MREHPCVSWAAFYVSMYAWHRARTPILTPARKPAYTLFLAHLDYPGRPRAIQQTSVPLTSGLKQGYLSFLTCTWRLLLLCRLDALLQ